MASGYHRNPWCVRSKVSLGPSDPLPIHHILAMSVEPDSRVACRCQLLTSESEQYIDGLILYIEAALSRVCVTLNQLLRSPGPSEIYLEFKTAMSGVP